MKNIKYFIFTLITLLAFSACSEAPALDPPVLSDKWITVYDIDSEGISKNWINEFPNSNFTGSTWEDWQTPTARYRWHKQRFKVGTLDSTSCYYLNCSTIASPSLIWLNGKLLNVLEYSENYTIPIDKELIENDYNEIIIRNEYKENSFGIHHLDIVKNSGSSCYDNKKYDYHAMPLYNDMPSFSHDMIIYEAYVRQIEDGKFSNLINMSSRLQQLGVNMVRLLPIHPATRVSKTSYPDPYAVRDYFSTAAELGSMTQFSSLRALLHRNNIKLMIDSPITFSAKDHSWVRDYKNYYITNAEGTPLSDKTHNNTALFDLNDTKLRSRLYSYFDFWLDQGVDAFRIDNSENLDKEFYSDLRDHFIKKGKNVFLSADGIKAEHMLYGFNTVDGKELYKTFLAIKEKRAKAGLIGETLNKEIKSYPAGTKIIHYTETLDTERAWDALGVPDHHLALFTIFTAPGIPMIQAGEELRDPPTFSLTEKKDVVWYRIYWPTYRLIEKLSKLRKDSPILTRGDFKQIATTESIAGFSRRYRNETWFILMNYSDHDITYNIDAKNTVFSDGSSKVVGEGKVSLKAKGYCIVK